MVVGGLVPSTWVSVTWSRGHKLVANLEESFVLGAQSRPSDPKPEPYASDQCLDALLGTR